ncbi:hypothetical protein [Dictyobacter kobayashii]|uniref:Uncharacterized protein n=1 Tax=Dictyobacter kobayashii TaxID=2014872 RepID=A0A402AD12_9CHLR|nr:hypothetical protein [Dictyobacter kobayashii]GCE16973.1 hypothetical protein KDK_07730 [Dictyobacter kobayashii]
MLIIAYHLNGKTAIIVGGTTLFKGKPALETQKSTLETETVNELPAPQGIGMAVAFDWGLAVQIAFTPIFMLLFRPSSMLNITGFTPIGSNVFFVIVALVIACLPALFGEMIRSGRYWARNIQLVANILLSLGGLVGLINLYQSIKIGNYWPLVTEIILLIFSP